MRGVLWGTEFWHFNVHQFQYDRVELKAFFSYYYTWATETCWFLAFDVQRTFQMLSSSERNRLWKGLSFCWIFLLVFYLQDLVHFSLPLKHHFQPVESEDWQTAAQWKGTKHLNLEFGTRRVGLSVQRDCSREEIRRLIDCWFTLLLHL